MRQYAAALAIMIFLVIVVGTLWASGLAKSGYMERVVSSRNTGASSMQTEKLYWEGDRLRMERYTVAGQSVQIRTGSTLYMYSPAQKKAIKLNTAGKGSKSVQDMLQMMAGSTKGGKKVGAGSVVGIKCDVYIVPISGSNRTAKVYMSKDSRLPVPLKVQISAGSGSQTIEVKKVKLNYNIPDSTFSLPKGTKVEEQKLPKTPKAK